MTDDVLLELARQCGFDHVGMLNTAALEFRSEVRDMCAADRCGCYGKRWTCPPYCGTLEEIRQRAKDYGRGVLAQCTAEMEDDFDLEAMTEAEHRLQESFSLFAQRVRERYPDCLPMGAGGCRNCKICTCPDEPCRFPDRAFPSMEAYGLLVSEVCERSGMKYYYGPRTVTFSCCVLIE